MLYQFWSIYHLPSAGKASASGLSFLSFVLDSEATVSSENSEGEGPRERERERERDGAKK